MNGQILSVKPNRTMKNSKLVRLLSRLSASEIDGFGAYLRGVHAGEDTPLSFFEYLYSFYPDFEGEGLEKESIAQELGLRTAQSGKRISNLASQVYGWLIDYLAWQKFHSEENKFEYYRMAMEAAREKKLEKEFHHLAGKASEWLDASPASIWLPAQYMRLAHAQYYYTPTKRWKAAMQYLDEATTHLHRFFHTSNLKYFCEMKNRTIALQEDDSRLKKFQSAGAEDFEAGFVLARLYSLCAELLTKDNDENYENFYNAFMSNDKPLGKEDEQVLLKYLINAIARRIPGDEELWMPRAFRLYRYGLARGILIMDGYLTDLAFHNIIHVACGAREMAWAEEFVNAYAEFLVDEGRDSTINLALARIAFERSKFGETLELLNGLVFKSYSFAIQARLLQVRCFYEQGETLAFDSLLKSFDALLSRNKVVNKESTLAAYRNFLKILRMLGSGNHTRQQLEEAIREQEHLVCGAWLKRKVQSLPE